MGLSDYGWFEPWIKADHITYDGGVWGYFKCWLGYHDYYKELVYEGPRIEVVNFVCGRCGEAWGFTHFGPFEFRIGA